MTLLRSVVTVVSLSALLIVAFGAACVAQTPYSAIQVAKVEPLGSRFADLPRSVLPAIKLVKQSDTPVSNHPAMREPCPVSVQKGSGVGRRLPADAFSASSLAEHRSPSISCTEQNRNAVFRRVISSIRATLEFGFINLNSIPALLAHRCKETRTPSPAASTVITSARSSTSFRLGGSSATAARKASASGKTIAPEQCSTVV